MNHSRKAVFISHASQDADAARRLADALRAAGIEVWLDTTELRGGDAWDASIRQQIRDCRLFVPLVSANTESRSEGYFRLEWKLAVDRSHLMADDEVFIVPVAIDATEETLARVPDAFRERQWIRMPPGSVVDEVVGRLARLLEQGPKRASSPPIPNARAERRRRAVVTAAAIGAIFLGTVFAFALWDANRARAPAFVTPESPSRIQVGLAANSVAVLPFRNLSDDKQNDYFSDGVSEELLTTLQKVPGLQVAARSSSFAFKETNVPAQEVGSKLGVVHLVEGSVRKAGNSVRITARLTQASTGRQLWSDAYTREAGDVLAVQSELAQDIVGRLRGFLDGSLTENEKTRIRTQVLAAARGGTRNPEAHEEYLQGLYYLNQEALPQAGRHLNKAVSLDPSFALAWADLSRAGWLRGAYAATAREYEEGFRTARRAADKAIQLDPQLAAGWLARSSVQMAADFEWNGAAESLRQAQNLAPNDPEVLHKSGRLAYATGRKDSAADLAKRAVMLDPLDARKRILLASALDSLGRYEAAQAEFQRVTEMSPKSPYAHAGVALMLLRRGRLEEAGREIAHAPVEWQRLTVHAQIMWALGRKAESDASLKRLHDSFQETGAYQLAQVYGHRADRDRAFEWLRRAARQRDPGLALCKLDRSFEPLHADVRWLAFLKELGVAESPPATKKGADSRPLFTAGAARGERESVMEIGSRPAPG